MTRTDATPAITPTTAQENPVTATTATLVKSNPAPDFWTSEHNLYRLTPPLNVDDTTSVEYVVTVVVAEHSERVPAELRAAAGTTDGAWFAVFPDGSPDNAKDYLLGDVASREVIGTATHESILALVPAEVAA